MSAIINPGGSGSGTPGGADTQIQFNDAGSFGGDTVLVWDKTNDRLGVGIASPTGQLHISQPTQTVAGIPALRVETTWNAGAELFTGLLLNVTNTSSLATSNLLDLQVGGVSQFRVGRNGAITAGVGSATFNGQVNFNNTIFWTTMKAAELGSLALQGGIDTGNSGYSFVVTNGTVGNYSATTGHTVMLATGQSGGGSRTFAPTSGTGTFSALAVEPAINQTGGASGVTRGVYINPTITAAAEFRSLETVEGNVILGSTSGNVGIGTTSFGTSAARVLALANGTAPSTSPADMIQLYAEDVAASSELKVRDEAGNITTLSPHNFSLLGKPSEPMAWSYYSERGGKAVNVDMLAVIREVELLSGKSFVKIERVKRPKKVWDEY